MSAATREAIEAPVLEIFSSFQGEGPRVGERQVFIRLARCDLRCAFCDTPDSYPVPETARIQVQLAGDREDRPTNPLTVETILAAVKRLDRPAGLHAAVSITGGEPLLHPRMVKALGWALREMGLRVHVETGGHRPGAVRHVLEAVDEVTPDLKLESATGAPTPWDAHAETYDILEASGKGLAVKVVVGATTTEAEIEEAALFVATHMPSAPLVLLPATPFGEGPARPTSSHLFRLHQAAAGQHPDVRVIPQVHRFLGLR